MNISVQHATDMNNEATAKIVCMVNLVILCGVISLLGAVSNVINMVVFYKQGLNTTINISFFSLAVADLASLLLQQVYNMYANPLFLSINLPIVHRDFQHLTSGFERETFARITCQITAFITAERCLCVVFPLQIKQIITPKKTTIIMVSIYSFTVISTVPIYCTNYITWKFFPDSNTTLLGLSVTEHNAYAEAFVYFTHGIVVMLSFLMVLTFTSILIFVLGQKREWRQAANVGQEKAKAKSKRDRATITMVVLIACILMVCYTPAVMLCLVTFLVPQFNIWGDLASLNNLCWSFALLLENVNSSVNIFLYYKMSSRYRQTFQELFSMHILPDRIVAIKGLNNQRQNK